MTITPPGEDLFDQPPMEPMELFGRVRSLTESSGFSGVLPAVWQCSDESQGLKKALFGYVFDTPVFNLGRVGAILDPNRLEPASHHGKDLVILGGSHIGGREIDGFGCIERAHGKVAPCCGMLAKVLKEYLGLYRRAASLITLRKRGGGTCITIPYPYLLRKPAAAQPRLDLRLAVLVEGSALEEGGQGKTYRLHPGLAARFEPRLGSLGEAPVPIGRLFQGDLFRFVKKRDPDSLDPSSEVENSLFDFLPEVVSSRHPHRRLADMNT
ncbi:hypothetical protein [uncultured Desulfuromonas sp.]|nr:hypothetical protein [uncultured Desulfuromonas sp.]